VRILERFFFAFIDFLVLTKLLSSVSNGDQVYTFIELEMAAPKTLEIE
jgi:hypothetical protein